MRDEYESGIGGGLMFLIIYLLTIQPLATFISLLMLHTVSSGAAVEAKMQWLFGAHAGVGVVSSILLWNYTHRLSVFFGVLAICISAPVVAATGYLVAEQPPESALRAVLAPIVIPSLTGAVVWSTVWSWYLLRSRRVKEHYL